MTHIEEAIIEKLQSGGPCCLDDLATHLSRRYSWGEVFIAVDRMSRDGGCCFGNSGTRPIRSHSAPRVHLQLNVESRKRKARANAENAEATLLWRGHGQNSGNW